MSFPGPEGETSVKLVHPHINERFDSKRELGFSYGQFDESKTNRLIELLEGESFPEQLTDAYALAPIKTQVYKYRWQKALPNPEGTPIFDVKSIESTPDILGEIKTRMLKVERAGFVGVPVELTDPQSTSRDARDVIRLYKHYTGENPIGEGQTPRRSKLAPGVISIGVANRPIPTEASAEVSRLRGIVKQIIEEYAMNSDDDLVQSE